MVIDKKIVNTIKKDFYFNRHGCSLYGNKARFSVWQICVTVTKSFFNFFSDGKAFLSTVFGDASCVQEKKNLLETNK